MELVWLGVVAPAPRMRLLPPDPRPAGVFASRPLSRATTRGSWCSTGSGWRRWGLAVSGRGCEFLPAAESIQNFRTLAASGIRQEYCFALYVHRGFVRGVVDAVGSRTGLLAELSGEHLVFGRQEKPPEKPPGMERGSCGRVRGGRKRQAHHKEHPCSAPLNLHVPVEPSRRGRFQSYTATLLSNKDSDSIQKATIESGHFSQKWPKPL